MVVAASRCLVFVSVFGLLLACKETVDDGGEEVINEESTVKSTSVSFEDEGEEELSLTESQEEVFSGGENATEGGSLDETVVEFPSNDAEGSSSVVIPVIDEGVSEGAGGALGQEEEGADEEADAAEQVSEIEAPEEADDLLEDIPISEVPPVEEPDSAPFDDEKLLPSCYQPHSELPIIQSMDFIEGASWNDPSVMRVDDQFVLYASADINFNQNIKIYRFVSADGVNWALNPSTAVFEKSKRLFAWDRKSVETPAVVYFNNRYHLFYTGYDESFIDVLSYRIGHATSEDGITWVRDDDYLLAPSAPYDAPNFDFNQYIVAEPAPVVFDNKLYLYFTALGADADLATTLQVIGVVISENGEDWGEPQVALSPDQNLYPRHNNYKGYSTPSALVINGKVHLYYDVATDVPFQQVKLHHGVSSDGLNDWVEDSEEIFDRNDFTWTGEEIRAPSALMVEDSLYLYFAGQSGYELGIGLARCNLSHD